MLTIAGSMFFRGYPGAGSGQVQRMSCLGAAVRPMTRTHDTKKVRKDLKRLRTLERKLFTFVSNQRT